MLPRDHFVVRALIGTVVAVGLLSGAACGGITLVGDECSNCFIASEGTYSGTTVGFTGTSGDDSSCASLDTIDV